MLKLNKKLHIYGLGSLIFLLFGLFLFIPSQAFALSVDVNQVKVPGNPAVYYLNHNTHQRKVYINAAVFLDYGNDWGQIKVISPEELVQWPETRLIKTADSDDLYYINDGKKVLMRNLQDIINYHLENVLPITVSEFELSQYQDESSYQEAGLEKNSGLKVSQDLNLDQSSPNYSLVPNTSDNQVMTLYLTAETETLIFNSISFQIGGIYSADLIKGAYLVNTSNNKRIESSSSFNSDRQLTIRFNPNDFIIPAGNTMAVRVMLDLNQMANTSNQTIQLKLLSAEAINANLSAIGQFPLIGRQFTLFDAGDILAQVQVNEQSLGTSANQQNMGRFLISEKSGNEDVYIKEMIFRDYGSVTKNDLNNFKLKKDNQIISSAPTMEGNLIIFDIAYLRLPANGDLNLTVSGNLSTDYTSGRSVNLDLMRIKAVGKTYGLSLNAVINNINENFNLG
ncbi:hypothetical protein JXE04_01160 [Patescibacteria group bacterium]|nr:hypothetical protein [Patescibacteria group bacterium]